MDCGEAITLLREQNQPLRLWAWRKLEMDGGDENSLARRLDDTTDTCIDCGMVKLESEKNDFVLSKFTKNSNNMLLKCPSSQLMVSQKRPARGVPVYVIESSGQPFLSFCLLLMFLQWFFLYPASMIALSPPFCTFRTSSRIVRPYLAWEWTIVCAPSRHTAPVPCR